MKKAMIGLLGVLVMVGGLVSTSLGWERGTHAYIAHLVKKGGGPNTSEAMYAATVPDAFNFFFTPPGVFYKDFLYQQTHFEVMSLWAAAKTGPEKAAAKGFISHNNEWGADRTAHTRSLTLDPTEGYVITKAKILNSILMGDPGYAALMGGLPDLALEICHELVEAAGDIILKNADPSIGPLLVELASRPRINIQRLMVKTYAMALATFSASTPAPMSLTEAMTFVAGAENEFRLTTIGYGYLMQGDDETMKANIIDTYKSLAAAFLGMYGVTPPDDAVLTALISGALDGALMICQADYMVEVNATAAMVMRELKIRLK